MRTKRAPSRGPTAGDDSRGAAWGVASRRVACILRQLPRRCRKRRRWQFLFFWFFFLPLYIIISSSKFFSPSLLCKDHPSPPSILSPFPTTGPRGTSRDCGGEQIYAGGSRPRGPRRQGETGSRRHHTLRRAHGDGSRVRGRAGRSTTATHLSSAICCHL